MRGDRVHQRRVEAVVGLQPLAAQRAAHFVHLRGRRAALDDRRDEGREARAFPALLRRQLRMDEVETMERVILVLDPAVHVHATLGARIALDCCLLVDDLQLVLVGRHRQLVARDHAYDRECRTFRLPALGAAAGVVVGDLRVDLDLHLVTGAPAFEGPARESRGPLGNAFVHGGMDG